MIKKILCIFVAAALVLSLAACSGSGTPDSGSEQGKKEIVLSEIMDDISANAELPEECIDILTDADLLDYYGIEASLVKSFAIRMNASGYQDELVMIEAVDNAAASEISALLEQKLADDAEAMRTYLPEQYEIIRSCGVDTNGVYVSMFVSADAATMIDIYNSYFR